MKISAAVFVAAASATEKKVPPRHPLQRLNRLVEFSEEILTDWFEFLPSQQSWINKFARNAGRMERNFKRGNLRCGFYDDGQLPHGGPRERRDVDEIRYNRNNPKEGVKQLITGFRKWAERYISECSGQKKYQFQVNRMIVWNLQLQGHLRAHYKKDCPDQSRPFDASNFVGCFGETKKYINGQYQYCEPAEKPETCSEDSWEELYGYCGVSELRLCSLF